MPSVITKPVEFVKSLQALTRRRHCFIHKLPQDVWVNHVFPLLHIEDILRVRRTCKHLFRLTHEPIIWKRILLSLQFPMPALRPSLSWSNPRVNHEIEQIVTRAISLDFNFRSAPTKVMGQNRVNASFHHTSVKIMPGGRHVFACFADRSGYRRGFVLYDMDNPRYRTYMEVARVVTQSNPIDFEAKYVLYEGRYGIMVSYIQRKFTGSNPDGYQPDDFTADTDLDIDWPANVIYTCCTHFLDLEDMEQIVDPFVVTPLNELPLGGCCEEVSSLQDDHTLSNPTLFTWKGRPHLLLQEGTSSFIFQDLTDEAREVVRMEPMKNLGPDWEVEEIAIRAFRVLPTEVTLDILVILTVKQVFIETRFEVVTNYLELYQVPLSGHQPLIYSKACKEIDADCDVLRYKISEPTTYFYQEAGVDHPEELQFSRSGPVPVSIYAEVAKPRGIHHYTVWPNHIVPRINDPVRPTAYLSYDLSFLNRQSVRRLEEAFLPIVLPGCERAIVLISDAIDRTDRPKISQIRRYVSPGVPNEEYPKVDYEDAIPSPLRKPRLATPMMIYDDIARVQPVLKKALEENGLIGASWDETSGRLALIAETEKGHEIFLLALSHFRKGDIKDRFPSDYNDSISMNLS